MSTGECAGIDAGAADRAIDAPSAHGYRRTSERELAIVLVSLIAVHCTIVIRHGSNSLPCGRGGGLGWGQPQKFTLSMYAVPVYEPDVTNCTPNDESNAAFEGTLTVIVFQAPCFKELSAL